MRAVYAAIKGFPITSQGLGAILTALIEVRAAALRKLALTARLCLLPGPDSCWLMDAPRLDRAVPAQPALFVAAL